MGSTTVRWSWNRGRAFWHHEHEALQATRAQIVASTLEPLATFLKENPALIKELEAEPFVERDSGILASYVAKTRRDGVAKHSDLKQRLDTLAENNTAIVTLIKVYAPYTKRLALTTEADRFRTYASA